MVFDADQESVLRFCFSEVFWGLVSNTDVTDLCEQIMNWLPQILLKKIFLFLN